MQQENKRFLLKSDTATLLEDLKTQPIVHRLFFTKIKLCKEVRYEHIPGHYTRIVRSGAQHPQTVTYDHVTKKQYQKAKRKQKGASIRKESYPLTIDKCQLAIQRYDSKLEDLHILEIPQRCYRKHPELLRHKLLDRLLLTEVTDDPRYEEKYLALYGNPARRPYNLYAIFKSIEQGRTDRPETLIFDEMKSSDAVRILLYHRFIQMQHAGTRIIAAKEKGPDPRDLVLFRRKLTETLLLFKQYENLFDEAQLQKSLTHLQKIERMLLGFEDLRLIRKNFVKFHKKIDSDYLRKVIASAEEKLRLEAHSIARYFSGREFSIIFRQYELLLKERKSLAERYEAGLPIAYTLKLHYRALISELRHLIDLLEACDDEKSLQRIYDQLADFTLFVEIFGSRPTIRKHAKRVEAASAALQRFQKVLRRAKKLLIVRMIREELTKEASPELNRFFKKTEKEITARKRIEAQKLFKSLKRLF